MFLFITIILKCTLNNPEYFYKRHILLLNKQRITYESSIIRPDKQ